MMKRKAKLIVGVSLVLAAVAGVSVQSATADGDKLTKTLEKMANAIDHYNSVEVSFEAEDLTGPTPVNISEEIAMRLRPDPAGRADTKSHIGSDKKSFVFIRNGDQRYELKVEEGVYSLIRTAKMPQQPVVPTWDRAKPGKDGEMWIQYRRAPIEIEAVGADALFPQEEVFALIQRSDKTEIVGEEQLLGRNALILEVIPAEPLRKTRDRILFWVDESTGILLKQEHYKGEKLVRSLTATKLVINPEIDPAKFQINIPDGARLQNPDI